MLVKIENRSNKSFNFRF